MLNVVTGGVDLLMFARKLGLNIPIPGMSASEANSVENWIGTDGFYGLTAFQDIIGVVNGWQQGGAQGASLAGMDAQDFVLALDHLMGYSISTGQFYTAVIIGAVVSIATLIFGGNHDKPADMPDKYDTARFTQYVGELQGSASTAYAPAYNPAADPVQSMLGGLPELSYIQDWIRNNLNAPNQEVQREAEKLLPLYGTTGDGKLSFQHDIGNESVVGGTESGTYITIHADAGQAISEIEILNATFPDSVTPPPALQPPNADYGGLDWVPFILPTGDTGYWAAKGDGTYYYFGPDPVLYHDNYPGEVQPQDVSTNAVGYAPTFDFAAADGTGSSASDGYGSYYGGVSYSG